MGRCSIVALEKAIGSSNSHDLQVVVGMMVQRGRETNEIEREGENRNSENV